MRVRRTGCVFIPISQNKFTRQAGGALPVHALILAIFSLHAHIRALNYTLMRTYNLLSLPPPFAKGIFYQRPNKLSEMNHYIPKYRLRSDLRM